MHSDKKKMVIPVIIGILVVLAGIRTILLVKKYKPSKEIMPLEEYFQVGDKQIQIILQDELYEKKGLYEDGQIYLDIELVKKYLNSRFYWDGNENQLLYTTATAVISAETGSNVYYTNKSKETKEYPIVRVEGGTAYIALDYVKDYTALDYTKYEEPDRVVINYRFDEPEDHAKTDRKAALRYEPGIKSPILVNLAKGEEVLLLETEDEETGFCKVMSSSGVIGYVKAKALGKAYEFTHTTDFKEETYPHILKDEKINLVWHQVTTQAANDGLLNLMDATKGVNVVVPTWFTVSGNQGDITSLASDTYVSRVHGLGAEIWGLCNDFSSDSKIGKVLSRTSSRQRLEKNLVAEAIRYSLDGINIDFEYVKKENGEDFIQFIRELGIMCRNNGIVLSVDNYAPTEYSQYYNRAEQAAVADYVITMAYDEYYAGSEESGPVASLNYVKDAVANSLAQVPAEQTIIALPFYSRLWKETTKDGKTKVTSEAYSMAYSSDLLENAGVKPAWDEAAGMNYGEYKKDNALYRMWIEDETSLEEKVKAAAVDGNVAGLAFWKLGLEKASVWDMIIKYTN